MYLRRTWTLLLSLLRKCVHCKLSAATATGGSTRTFTVEHWTWTDCDRLGARLHRCLHMQVTSLGPCQHHINSCNLCVRFYTCPYRQDTDSRLRTDFLLNHCDLTDCGTASRDRYVQPWQCEGTWGTTVRTTAPCGCHKHSATECVDGAGWAERPVMPRDRKCNSGPVINTARHTHLSCRRST